MHATAEEAIAETERMFNIYADFCENYLAMPVVKGQKTDKESPPGEATILWVRCTTRRPPRPAPPTTSATVARASRHHLRRNDKFSPTTPSRLPGAAHQTPSAA